MRISLGRGAYIGERALLVASNGGTITIGDDTSLQDDCMAGGDVQIGAHCLFGKYVFLSSTKHRFSDHPGWLIKDQDRMAHATPGMTGLSKQIVIEDDCWIGQGVVINPGIEIGRGAVVGANSVVTRNAAPYEIHGGVPNRCIGHRLQFVPPKALWAGKDDDLPYFYRGFCLSRDDLAASRINGVVNARGTAWLVLAGAKSGNIILNGQCTGSMQFDISVNGVPGGAHRGDGAFEIRIAVPEERSVVRESLRNFTVVEMAPRSSGSYGIVSAMLEGL